MNAQNLNESYIMALLARCYETSLDTEETYLAFRDGNAGCEGVNQENLIRKWNFEIMLLIDLKIKQKGFNWSYAISVRCLMYEKTWVKGISVLCIYLKF